MEVIGRAKHDYRDIGGRVTPGAITQDARAESDAGSQSRAVTEEVKADEWARRDMDMKLSAKELPIV